MHTRAGLTHRQSRRRRAAGRLGRTPSLPPAAAWLRVAPRRPAAAPGPAPGAGSRRWVTLRRGIWPRALVCSPSPPCQVLPQTHLVPQQRVVNDGLCLRPLAAARAIQALPQRGPGSVCCRSRRGCLLLQLLRRVRRRAWGSGCCSPAVHAVCLPWDLRPPPRVKHAAQQCHPDSPPPTCSSGSTKTSRGAAAGAECAAACFIFCPAHIPARCTFSLRPASKPPSLVQGAAADLAGDGRVEGGWARGDSGPRPVEALQAAAHVHPASPCRRPRSVARHARTCRPGGRRQAQRRRGRGPPR